MSNEKALTSKKGSSPTERLLYRVRAARDRGEISDSLCTDIVNALETYSPVETTAERRETGWIVENGKHNIEYRGMDASGIHWTADINKALRFARREDAEAFASGDEDAWRIVEHLWVKPSAQETSPWRPGSVRHGIRLEGAVPICDYCGFALITNEPRQCCDKGRDADRSAQNGLVNGGNK